MKNITKTLQLELKRCVCFRAAKPTTLQLAFIFEPAELSIMLIDLRGTNHIGEACLAYFVQYVNLVKVPVAIVTNSFRNLN